MTAQVIPISAQREKLPHNYEAEQAVLAALLANNQSFYAVDAILKPEHFFDPVHGRMFEAIARLVADGIVANPVTLKRLFDQDGGLERVGGSEYLVKVAASLVTVINVEDYAQVVLDLYMKREIIYLAERMLQMAQVEAYGPALGLLEQFEGEIAQVSDIALAQTSVVTGGQVLTVALKSVERALKAGSHITGVATGLKDFDWRTGGLHPGLYVIAGRPAMGKTSLALNLGMFASRVAMDRGSGGVFFASLEMGEEEIGQKMLALLTNIGADRQRRGDINEKEFERLAQATADRQKLPQQLDPNASATPSSIMSRARRMQKRQGLDMVIIDYIQLMDPERERGDDGNRVQQVSRITRALKKMSKALNVPVIALSQLSRKVEDREDKRPMLSDLRESGSIEQDADCVIFLFREEYYLQHAPEQRDNESDEKFQHRLNDYQTRLARSRDKAEVIIAKNRMGPVGMVETRFTGATGRFSDWRVEDPYEDRG